MIMEPFPITPIPVTTTIQIHANQKQQYQRQENRQITDYTVATAKLPWPSVETEPDYTVYAATTLSTSTQRPTSSSATPQNSPSRRLARVDPGAPNVRASAHCTPCATPNSASRPSTSNLRSAKPAMTNQNSSPSAAPTTALSSSQPPSAISIPARSVPRVPAYTLALNRRSLINTIVHMVNRNASLPNSAPPRISKITACPSTNTERL